MDVELVSEVALAVTHDKVKFGPSSRSAGRVKYTLYLDDAFTVKNRETGELMRRSWL